MKKTLLFFFILTLAIALTIFFSFYEKKIVHNSFSCQSDYIEDRVENNGMILQAHVSIVLNYIKNSGIVSFNGNLTGQKETYKIKRTTSFSLESSGDDYDMREIDIYITQEDNTPAEKLKDFIPLTNDINFSMFKAIKNDDSSLTIYNSHEPILVCSQ